MNREVRFTVKSKVFQTALPVYRFVVKGCLRLAFRDSFVAGSSKFLGSAEFLKRCETAVHLLSGLDPEAYRKLTTELNLLFWYHGTSLRDDRFNAAYSVPQSYVKWGERGIIARVVYGIFMQQQLGDTL